MRSNQSVGRRYQDPNEFGAQIVPVTESIADRCRGGRNKSSTFCATNLLFREKFAGAALSDRAAAYPVGYITPGLVLMDALHIPYQEWIVEMAERMVQLPVRGIAWDRSDHTSLLNYRLDDGIAFDVVAADEDKEGRCSWLGSGWQVVVRRVAEIFHRHRMSMFHNTYANRMDFNRFFDGFYDENGDQAWRAPVDAVLAISKPLWFWDHCGARERRRSSAASSGACGRDDAATHNWLAQTFYFGAMPTTPYPPCGDHTITIVNIRPSTLRVYEAFVPLFALFRTKRWVLVPRAVSLLRHEHVDQTSRWTD
jgi:hypothetical protein